METKAIMISINPEWVAKILNGEKTIEVRKHFPKDYKGWVYIYCTKKRPWLVRLFNGLRYLLNLDKDAYSLTKETTVLNGKVVARFYCDKVWIMGDSASGCWDYSKSIEENHKTWSHYYDLGFVSHKYLHKYEPILDDDPNTYSQEYGTMLRNESCLSQKEIYNYLNDNKLCMYGKKGYAIHISQLEIFDRSKELISFYKLTDDYYWDGKWYHNPLTKAPQSWCYIVSDAKY